MNDKTLDADRVIAGWQETIREVEANKDGFVEIPRKRIVTTPTQAMNDKTLVERLELAANDAIHDDAANAIRAAILEMARLDAENFRLAAGSCDVEGGKIGDEHGHFRCSLQSRIEALEAALRECATAYNGYAAQIIAKQALENSDGR